MKVSNEVKPLEMHRKLLKPLVEKKRRERINNSLEKLRIFLSETLRNEKLKNPKVEKAEILECTVQFLQARMSPLEDSEVTNQDFQSDFQQCLQIALHLINSKADLHHVTKDFLSQQLSMLKPCSSPVLNDIGSLVCSTLPKLLPSYGYIDRRHISCPNGTTMSLGKTLVDTQIANPTVKTWRPWV
ncbi:hypothetical protein GDO86_007033 [Hymenochirus boettgeri]|uniref:BHLH domain-containing protein n=1 Tax=Hymenochirus boettgeri TaxID=247094 RepID=A0A8T2JAX3_9PIPI|nr:hypothetical protein GDO86_007033 [Hymenochirus boettgeri]